MWGAMALNELEFERISRNKLLDYLWHFPNLVYKHWYKSSRLRARTSSGRCLPAASQIPPCTHCL